MWIAFSAIAWSAMGRWKLMTIGLATPTVAPLTGLNDGGRNGGSPTNGVGSCPAAGPDGVATGWAGAAGGGAAGSPGGGGAAKGSPAGGATGAAGGGGGGASPGPGSTTPGSPGGWSGSASAGPVPSTTTAANAPVLRAARSVPLVDRDICIPPVTVCSPVSHSPAADFACSDRRTAGEQPHSAV